MVVGGCIFLWWVFGAVAVKLETTKHDRHPPYFFVTLLAWVFYR